MILIKKIFKVNNHQEIVFHLESLWTVFLPQLIYKILGEINLDHQRILI